MQVTEVRIKLMEGSEDRLRAFCSITLDHSFVIRDLKVIDGASGPFVAMPSRKLSGHCYRCNYKNHLRAAYCNQCGTKLKVVVSTESPQKLYADVAHPVNSECREMISAAVLAEFQAELTRASQPGYRSRYDDDFDAISESHDDLFRPVEAEVRTIAPPEDRGLPDPGRRVDDPQQPLRPPRAAPAVASPRQSDSSSPPPLSSLLSSEPSGPVNPASHLDAQAGVSVSPPTANYRVDSPDAGSPTEPTSLRRSRPTKPATSNAARDADFAAPAPEPPLRDDGFGAGIFD